ncbi:MAG TPA: hypothetical protein VKZ85_01770 [Woeseiaceae bacterium]|nr:hypothetical protein [Woeseiaceae bacterium]
MSEKYDRSLESLKNESTRQRWALFHRAIASAKQSNTEAMRQEFERMLAEAPAAQRTEPRLSIAQ